MKKNLFLVVLLTVVFLNSFLWMAIIPFNHAPDEFSHYAIPKFIVEHGRYPVFGQDVTVVYYEGNRGVSLSSLPPLAYLIQAAALKIGNEFLLARFTSVLAILAYVYFSWKALSLLEKNLFFRKATLLFLAFIPGVTFISSYVNSDAVALAASTFLIWQITYIVKNGLDRKAAILTGIGTGLVILSRLNGYILVPLACLLIISSKRLKYINYFLMGTIGVSGWWFWRNLTLFGEIFPLREYSRVHYSIWPQDKTHLAISQIIFQTNWLWITFKSFWANFDWNFLFLPETYYQILLILAVIASLGLIKHRRSKFVLVFMLIILTSIFQSLLSSSYFSFQPQGRYLYQSLLPVGVLFSWGLTTIFKNQVWQKITLILIAWGMVILNILSMVSVILPKYYSSLALYLPEIAFSKPLWLTQGFLLFYIFGFVLGIFILVIDFLVEVYKSDKIKLSL